MFKGPIRYRYISVDENEGERMQSIPIETGQISVAEDERGRTRSIRTVVQCQGFTSVP